MTHHAKTEYKEKQFEVTVAFNRPQTKEVIKGLLTKAEAHHKLLTIDTLGKGDTVNLKTASAVFTVSRLRDVTKRRGCDCIIHTTIVDDGENE